MENNEKDCIFHTNSQQKHPEISRQVSKYNPSLSDLGQSKASKSFNKAEEQDFVNFSNETPLTMFSCFIFYSNMKQFPYETTQFFRSIINYIAVHNKKKDRNEIQVCLYLAKG